jgi:hypothetical protein
MVPVDCNQQITEVCAFRSSFVNVEQSMNKIQVP